MVNIKTHIALWICLLMQLAVWGQGTKEVAVATVRDGNSITLSLRTGGYRLTPRGDGYADLAVDGLTTTSTLAGHPALPCDYQLVWLADGECLQVASVVRDNDTLLSLPQGLRIVPAAEPCSKEATASTIVADERAYAQPIEATAVAEYMGTMGKRRLYRIALCPFGYDPTLGILILHRSIKATFTIEHNDYHQPLPDRGRDLIVVAREEFRSVMQPFVRWKQCEGYRVKEIYTTASSRDSTKLLIDRVARSLRSATMPALLIVGDTPLINPYIGKAHPSGFDLHSTDLYYGELTGDYLPDMVVGRWPVNDSAELEAVVQKTLRYEQASDLDNSTLQRILLVAGDEERAPAPITTNGQVNYLSTMAKNSSETTDTMCYHNPASSSLRAEILSDIATGTGFLNYTAHCNIAGWSNPRLQASAIDSLGEVVQPLWVNNCCMSNNFAGDCFGEKLLRMPMGGAVAVIGATNNTMWNEDYYWAVGPKYPFALHPLYDTLRPGAFDALFAPNATDITAGDLLLSGNLAVTASGSPYDKFYWEIYCLLGDPTMKLYTSPLQASSVALPESVHIGDKSLHVLTEAGMRVAVVQADSLLGTAIADSNGEAVVALRWCVDTGSVEVWATGRNFRPSHLQTMPLEATSPLSMLQIHTTDSTLFATVANLLHDSLYAVYVALQQNSTDTATGATIHATDTLLAHLSPNERADITLAYNLSVAGATPIWHGTLVATTNGATFSLPVSHSLIADYPTLSLALLEPEGGAALRLTNGHNYQLQTIVQGAFDSLCVEVSTLPDNRPLSSLTTQQAVYLQPIALPNGTTHLHFNLSLYSGHHCEQHDFYTPIGSLYDCVAVDSDGYPWQSGGSVPWRVDSTMGHHESPAMRSGSIDYRQTSDLWIDLLTTVSDSVSFWARTSSEQNYDILTFSIDGQTIGTPLSGEHDWQRISAPLPAGVHRLRWRYSKDEATDEGNDCVWIDDVRLPLALWSSPFTLSSDCNPIGIDPVASEEKDIVAIYPNPSNGEVVVRSQTPIESVALTDMLGRTVLSQQGHRLNTLQLSVAHLPAGIYLLRLISFNQESFHKIAIQHQP